MGYPVATMLLAVLAVLAVVVGLDMLRRMERRPPPDRRDHAEAGITTEKIVVDLSDRD